MKRLILAASALLLVSCSDNEQMKCPVADNTKHWRQATPTTDYEYQLEIHALLPDNSCGGITAADLRKLFLDARRIPKL